MPVDTRSSIDPEVFSRTGTKWKVAYRNLDPRNPVGEGGATPPEQARRVIALIIAKEVLSGLTDSLWAANRLGDLISEAGDVEGWTAVHDNSAHYLTGQMPSGACIAISPSTMRWAKESLAEAVIADSLRSARTPTYWQR